jgi:hypothetical protein
MRKRCVYHLQVLFQLAYKQRAKPPTDKSLEAFVVVDKLQDQLVNMIFPRKRQAMKVATAISYSQTFR